MKTIKWSSKKGTELGQKYFLSDKRCLGECYKSCSWNKLNAEYRCKVQMDKENGKRFRILSTSHFFFTCGWLTQDGLRVETPSNSYLIKDYVLPF